GLKLLDLPCLVSKTRETKGHLMKLTKYKNTPACTVNEGHSTAAVLAELAGEGGRGRPRRSARPPSRGRYAPPRRARCPDAAARRHRASPAPSQPRPPLPLAGTACRPRRRRPARHGHS